MAPTPVTHPLRDRTNTRVEARRRAILAHPAGRGRPGPDRHRPGAALAATSSAGISPQVVEDGSMTTEYGLLVVVGATISSLVIRWASGGAVFELLASVLQTAGNLVGL